MKFSYKIKKKKQKKWSIPLIEKYICSCANTHSDLAAVLEKERLKIPLKD